jgi:outer membrane protein assembly factor BamE (lipoprotein component of BamABCDE complex)
MPEVVMKRRRLLVLAGVVLAAAVLVPAGLELHAYRQKGARGRPIDWEHFERIKEGMSRAEVEALLGGPPGDYHTENIFYCSFGVTLDGQFERWSGNEGAILIRFDKQDRVQRHVFMGAMSLPPPPLAERVRAWLRRVWP